MPEKQTTKEQLQSLCPFLTDEVLKLLKAYFAEELQKEVRLFK